MMDSKSVATSGSWGQLTYEEVNKIADRDGSLLVIPVGSIEQHGNHLPVATDTILVESVANEGADRANESVPVLTTPAVWSGISPHHAPFGGSISVDRESLLSLVEDVAQSGIETGFDAVLFLNGHGGNISLIGSAVSVVGDAHPDAEVLGLTYFQLAENFIDEIRESEWGGMAHAGEFETSLMLHLRPDLVGDDREGTYWDPGYKQAARDMFKGGPLSVYRTFDEYSASGAIGDPNLASAEKGKRIFDRLGDEIATLFEDIHEHTA